MIIQAMLFFGIGSITTWLLFSWTFDRDDTILLKKIRELERRIRELDLINRIWKRKLSDTVEDLMKIKDKENEL